VSLTFTIWEVGDVSSCGIRSGTIYVENVLV
jgi:hypothetical protein